MHASPSPSECVLHFYAVHGGAVRCTAMMPTLFLDKVGALLEKVSATILPTFLILSNSDVVFDKKTPGISLMDHFAFSNFHPSPLMKVVYSYPAVFAFPTVLIC